MKLGHSQERRDQNPGVVAEADRGTLFLDEIDSFPAQAKLLRFLQEGEFKPLGSNKTRRADVRVIAATNIDIEQGLQKHTLREDLFYRLSVMSISLPPLRERKDDIPMLANTFLSKWANKFGKDIQEISQEAIGLLMFHDWPGNVRELENTIQRAVILANQPLVLAQDILLSRQKKSSPGEESFREMICRTLDRFETSYLKDMLASSHGNISRAAKAAKISRRRFRQLLDKHKMRISAAVASKSGEERP